MVADTSAASRSPVKFRTRMNMPMPDVTMPASRRML
jgi:hypothetical protein